MFPIPSTATPNGTFAGAPEASVDTRFVDALHSAIELLPDSEKYTLPSPSTATPLGLNNPPTRLVTCGFPTFHVSIAWLEPSAMYRLPDPSTATPVGLPKPATIRGVSCCAGLHRSMAAFPVSAT